MTVRKGLGQANTFRTNNNTSTGYGIAYADEISGHRTVANLTALYALHDWQLSASGDNTGSDAIGQLWYVVNADGNGNGSYYQLRDWNKRNDAAGWIKFTGGGGSGTADLSNYVTKTDFGTTIETIDNKLNQKLDANSADIRYVKNVDLVSLTDTDIDNLWNTLDYGN